MTMKPLETLMGDELTAAILAAEIERPSGPRTQRESDDSW